MSGGRGFRYDGFETDPASTNLQVGGLNPQQLNVNVNIMSTPSLDETSSVSGSSQYSRRLPPLFVPDPGSEEYGRFKDVLKGMAMFNTLNDLPYHIKSDVEECLNIEKHDRNDWRGVASRLNLKPAYIEKLAKAPPENPCNEVFKEASNRKVTELLQALCIMERNDVLDIFYSHIDTSKSKNPGKQKELTKFPSQETTPSDSPAVSSPQSPFLGTPTPAYQTKKLAKQISIDSGIVDSVSRERAESNPRQHSEDHDKEVARGLEYETKVDFHTEESKKFWLSVPPDQYSTRKEWKHFEKTLQDTFPKDCKESQLLRLISYTLKIGYEDRQNKDVSDQDFANLVAWFGPCRAGKDGCFEKMRKLIKDSTTYEADTGAHSFFAGYMSKDEADKRITASEVGTFLIRFSASLAHKGVFIVVLKTPNGAEHHQVEGNPSEGKLTFGGKTYEDLTQLYKRRLCRGGVSLDGRTSCTSICRNLPLNSMFKSYNTGPSSASTGRGRGRWRSQQD